MLSKIRIGNTLDVAIKVLTNGEVESLEGRDIIVRLIDPRGAIKDITDWYLDVEYPNIIHFTIEGRVQRLTGVYRVEVWENKDGLSQAIFDQDMFQLVPRTIMEALQDSANLVRPQIEISGASLNVGGKDGAGIASITFVEHTSDGNKYEVLLTNGKKHYIFSGDGERGAYCERVYLQTQNETGNTYVMEYSDGEKFTFVAPRGLRGETGLTGATGATGPQGIQGEKGEKGDQGYTPYIENDHWFINGEDTGKRATVTVDINVADVQVDEETGQLYIEI